MGYFGCLGKTFRYISGQYMSVGSTPQRCDTLFMASGEVIVLAVARTMKVGIKIHSSAFVPMVLMHHLQFMCSSP